jgi:hypothetical protein
VVAKTDSKSMLAHMNQMILTLEYHCSSYASYETIPVDFLEDVMMDYLYSSNLKGRNYITPFDFWKQEIEV